MRGDRTIVEDAVVTGGSAPTLIERTIPDALLDAERRWPDVEAVVSVHQGIRLTFADLRRQADDIARSFLALGLQPGDRVAIWSPNCVEWLLTQVATASAGLILVNLNPAYRRTEAEFALRKTGTRALVTASRYKTSDYVGMTEDMDLAPLGGSGGNCPDLEFVVKIDGERRAGWLEFDDLSVDDDVTTGQLVAIKASLRPEEAVNIQFTSGTTGTPKGATLSHRNILNNGYFVGAAIRLAAGDRVCAPVPLYHCFGMVMGNLACLTHGATIVYPAPSFDPLATLRAVAAERCTALYGVPTMFIAMLQHAQFADFDLGSLRTGIMAGAPCPIEVMREVVERMNMPQIIIAYGMTETSPVSFACSIDDPLPLRVETVGRVMPHLEARITNDAGEVLKIGEPGEICVRGYSVMLGYWEEPEATATVLDQDGWMRTGDVGTIDAAGFCRIVGRLKDLIIRGGENIYPREIEEFLYQHPAIEEVSVVGIPDDRFGEEVCAWIKVHAAHQLDEDAVRSWCAGRIAHYKVPKVIRFVEDFPMTVTGKVQKFEMRRVMIEASTSPAFSAANPVPVGRYQAGEIGMNDTILVERDGPVLFLTLNRPSAMNVVNQAMAERMIELGSNLSDVAGDSRVIVLRGAGASFMAGGDIQEFKAHMPAVGDMLGPLIAGFHLFVQALAEAPQPILCSVHGAAAGGGFSLAIACDLVIAADTAKFALAYRTLGTSPDGGASYTLPRILGQKRAAEMLLLSGRLTAAQALTAGLVNRVVDTDALEAETLRMAQELAANGATANAAMKALLHASYGNGLAEQLEMERGQFLRCAGNPDFAEGVAAFLEKRSPVFVG